MSDTKIIHVDDKYQTVRVNNFLLSYGINNNELHDNEEYNNNVNREPTADEYQLLYDANNAFFQKYFESYCAKHKTSANNTSVQYSSQVQSVSYKKDKIPNDNYQVCVKYSYADMKYPINSNLTDELEVMAEGIRKFKFLCTCFVGVTSCLLNNISLKEYFVFLIYFYALNLLRQWRKLLVVPNTLKKFVK